MSQCLSKYLPIGTAKHTENLILQFCVCSCEANCRLCGRNWMFTWSSILEPISVLE